VRDLSETVGDIASSAAVIFLGTIIGQTFGLFGEILIARSLAPEEYGSLSLAYTVVLLASTVVLFGLHNGVTRLMSASESKHEQRQILYHGNLMTLVLSAIAGIILFLGRDFLAQRMDQPELAGLILLFLPILVVNPLRYIAYGVLRSKNRSFSAVLSKDIIGKTLPLLILAGAVVTSRESIGAVIYWIGIPLVMFLASSYFIRGLYFPSEIIKGTPDIKVTKRLWSFSWPLALSAFVFILLSHLDIVMIGYFLQPRFVGYYRSIQPLREAATFALGSVAFLYMPIATEYFEQNDITELGRIYTASTKWVMMGTFPVILVLGLFSDDIVRVFLGSSYQPAAPVLSILVFGLFFRAVVGLNGSTVKAIDRTRIELISAVLGLVSNFVLNISLIPRYGIKGAAVATVVGYIVYNSLEIAGIYRTVGIHPFSLNNVKPLLPPLLLGLGLFILLSDYQLGLFALLVIGVLLSMFQITSLFITASLTKEDEYIFEKIEKKIGINLDWLVK